MEHVRTVLASTVAGALIGAAGGFLYILFWTVLRGDYSWFPFFEVFFATYGALFGGVLGLIVGGMCVVGPARDWSAGVVAGIAAAVPSLFAAYTIIVVGSGHQLPGGEADLPSVICALAVPTLGLALVAYLLAPRFYEARCVRARRDSVSEHV